MERRKNVSLVETDVPAAWLHPLHRSSCRTFLVRPPGQSASLQRVMTTF